MLIGRSDIDYSALACVIDNPACLLQFVDSMVPEYVRHIPQITMNQRYYVAIHIRNLLHIPYKVRAEASNHLIKGIVLTGVLSSFTPVSELFTIIDVDNFCSAMEDYIS